MEEKNWILLRTEENDVFKVEEAIAFQSLIIKNLVEDMGNDEVIPLPFVSSKILTKVIEYCKQHVTSEVAKEEPKEKLLNWNANFVKVDRKTLLELIETANYLNIQGLLSLTCQVVADSTRGMSPEEVREYFNIENKFTSEEEEAIKNINAWAFK
ncbi:hypothetical protein M758_7G060500 [Ceratodon purpureus]|nr:hypothetical protein M758_7G060500 [Ceratodon purpureus]